MASKPCLILRSVADWEKFLDCKSFIKDDDGVNLRVCLLDRFPATITELPVCGGLRRDN